jgi:hypothetical protein
MTTIFPILDAVLAPKEHALLYVRATTTPCGQNCTFRISIENLVEFISQEE